MLKGTKVYSVFTNSCPKCQEGKVFKTSNPFLYNRLTDMHDTCSVCGEDFKRETGFYYGAMYVSYGLTAAYCIGLTCIFVWWTDWVKLEHFLPVLFTSLLILFGWFFRSARLLWLNLFVKYDKTAKNRRKSS